MANRSQPASKPTELAVCDSPSELQTTGHDESQSPLIETSKRAKIAAVDIVDQQWIDTAVSSAQPYLQEISRAFDCLRRYYVESFLPSRTPRKTSISPRTSNSFSAEALVLLCEDFEMCPHPFPPSFICKVYSSLTNVSDSPADLLARSLIVLACSGFRFSGLSGKLLTEVEAFVALLQHMHYSQGPARVHSALGLGTAPRPIFRVSAPSYDGKNEKLYFVDCLPMLVPLPDADSHKHALFRGMSGNGSAGDFAARGSMKANQVTAASRISRMIKLFREENNIELTGVPVLTQKSSDFERGIQDLLEFNRNKEMKVSEMRQRQLQAELMQFNYTPQICAKSDHIAGELHRVGSVEDRLLAEGRLAEAKVATARMMQSRAVLVHAQRRPSSAPVRSRPVSAIPESRASDDQVIPANKADAPLPLARKRETHSVQQSHDFKPSILPASKRLHRSVRVEYALTAWGQARNAKWEAIRAQEEFQKLQLAKRPSSAGPTRRQSGVDGLPAHAAEKISSWRLHSPESAPESGKGRTEKVVENLKLKAPSFQPCVDKMSRKIDAQLHKHTENSSGQLSRFQPKPLNLIGFDADIYNALRILLQI